MKDDQVNINGILYEQRECDGETVFVPVKGSVGKEVTVSIPLDTLYKVRSVLSIIGTPYDVDVQPPILYSYWTGDYATFTEEAKNSSAAAVDCIDYALSQDSEVDGFDDPGLDVDSILKSIGVTNG